MLIIFNILILTVVQQFFVQGERIDWDLAIVVEKEIKLLSSNGSVIKSHSEPFTSLKALGYDRARDQFVVSDMYMQNDTIYTVRITKENVNIVPIIQNLPGDVQGLAVDPLEDILYWTDKMNQTINYVFLNDTRIADTFLKFDDKQPHAIAIDICRRYMYYTNPTMNSPSIERINLNKTHHEVLVSNTIMLPVGLAIDYNEQRLYWADSRIGTEVGRIESISLDGKDRRLVIERRYMEPYGLAIDRNAIYWTDTSNKVLYKFSKQIKNAYADPERLVEFSDMPTGLVTNNHLLEKDCYELSTPTKEYQDYNDSKDISRNASSEDVPLKCLNGGDTDKSQCVCKQGFRGKFCEISLCNSDYCFSGNCYLSTSGQPRCDCAKGFMGARCEKNICDGYCLNQGVCDIAPSSDAPKCRCLEDFIGHRCEYRKEICDSYCKDAENTVHSDEIKIMCGCNYLERNTSRGIQSALSEKEDVLTKLQDPVVYLAALLLLSLLIIVALFIYIRLVKKRRPRIKKRIIVNKNVTPLTYRPQQNIEQCEITIENCCNMNVCETPCFEPTGEDKKKLITNMEGEDLY